MSSLSRIWNGWQKFILCGLIALLVIAHLSRRTTSFTQWSTDKTMSSFKKASYLSPAQLMSRPLTGAQNQIPKIFHQSWSSNELPAKFQRWSETCRKVHPDWEWVLWTDDDNLELLKKFMPSMLPTYEKLAGPIFRADVVRNAYMYLFGGVYADLDTDCLRSSDELFARFNVSTTRSQSLTGQPPALTSGPEVEQRSDADSVQKSFVGRMGTDNSFEHSIPNAWMASPPGHPFFKLMLQWTKKKVTSGEKLDGRPEAVTGPIALRNGIEEFGKRKDHGSDAMKGLEEILADPTPFSGVRGDAAIEILPAHYIYPYSWARDGDTFREFCSAERETFDAQHCKDLVGVDHWPSYTVTYWSHTWNWEGPNEGNLRKISEWRAV